MGGPRSQEGLLGVERGQPGNQHSISVARTATIAMIHRISPSMVAGGSIGSRSLGGMHMSALRAVGVPAVGSVRITLG